MGLVLATVRGMGKKGQEGHRVANMEYGTSNQGRRVAPRQAPYFLVARRESK